MDNLSSGERPVPLSARKDIQCHQANYLGQSCWVVKDPVWLKYFRLEPEQFAVLQLLDGQKTIDQLLAEYRKLFPSDGRTRANMQQIVLDLYQKGLAWSTRPGQGNAIKDRGAAQQWRQTKQTLKNVLFIRLPGFDPTRILNVGYAMTKWAYHPAVLIWAIAIIVYSWVFMLTHTIEISARLPTLESLTTWQTTVSLWLVIGATKIIHELGHALACRHAGGECHEIGMAFLVFSPCLYCDVSDSWTLRSKWHRIGIGLAGIHVELLLATFAFFGWWNSQPGEFNQLCFLVFVVSSISTLLFNLNPLLRLDGYYILSDWLEIPNLRQKADQARDSLLLNACLGIEVDEQPLPNKSKLLFVWYSIISVIYRSFLVMMICWMLYSTLKPWRMEYVGLALGVVSAGVGLISWTKNIRSTAKRFVGASSNRNRFRLRPAVSMSVLTFGVAGFFLMPLRIAVRAPLQIEYADAQHVYLNSDAQLAAVHVQPGQPVHAGQVLLELVSFVDADRLRQMTTQARVQEIELRKQKLLVDEQKSTLAEESLQSIRSEITDLKVQQDRLRVCSPLDGIVVEPPLRQRGSVSKLRLPTWDGVPTNPLNIGCALETGTHLVTVAPPDRFHAVLHIDPLDVHSIAVGQFVRIKLAHYPQRSFAGNIARISTASIASSSRNEDRHSRSNAQSQGNQYLATVQIDGDHGLFVPGIQGWARVTIQSQTAAQWIWRHVKSTF